MSDFYIWFTTFLEEKNLDLGEYVDDDIQLGDVCQAIVDSTEEEQEKIQDILVILDFKNGDLMHFFKYLAKSMTKEDAEKRRIELCREIFNRRTKKQRSKT